MRPATASLDQAILGVLALKGIATSAELQVLTGKSQPTLSRQLSALSTRVMTLGRARSTVYGLLKSIHGGPSQWPVNWIDEAGESTTLGQLNFLAGDWIHIDGRRVTALVQGRLPWFLSPLKAQGFLGRLLAKRLGTGGAGGMSADLEDWVVESVLFAAINLHDAPGAIVLGEPPTAASAGLLPADPAALANALDALSIDVAKTLPAGSSAGGEQPKFTARLHTGEHVLVKFGPPRGTPFGERWHDLLLAEALALDVLAGHGVEVARCEAVQSELRTFLVSRRFDRVGAIGRRHVVSVGAAHSAFVAGSYNNWAATCDVLASQRHLDRLAAIQARALQAFGRLIGNTDMHSGNLGLLVGIDGLRNGRLALAPVYDMLPMRWRPDPLLGGASDYSPFEPDAASLASGARLPALEFWERLCEHGDVSQELRRVAGQMAVRMGVP